MPRSRQVRVLIVKGIEFWCAQCLEYDIAVQAKDLDQLRIRLIAAFEEEYKESMRRKNIAFGGVDPAPQYFYDRWERRSKEFYPLFPPITSEAANVDINVALDA